MNPRQAAAYRNEIARAKLATKPGALLRAASVAAQMKRQRRYASRATRALAPRSEPFRPPTAAESALAARLLPHVCLESAVNREAHALGVARMILKAQGARR